MPRPRERLYLYTYRAKLRKEVIAAYGGRCTCCGEDRYEFLCLDHVHNDGAKRRKLGKDSYIAAKREGFPSRFTILCYNCNMAKAFYRVCPHKDNEGWALAPLFDGNGDRPPPEVEPSEDPARAQDSAGQDYRNRRICPAMELLGAAPPKRKKKVPRG